MKIDATVGVFEIMRQAQATENLAQLYVLFVSLKPLCGKAEQIAAAKIFIEAKIQELESAKIVEELPKVLEEFSLTEIQLLASRASRKDIRFYERVFLKCESKVVFQ